MKHSPNILTSFLDLLKVKHTKTFTEQTFNEHPHKYNLFGLSKMLSDYGVNNESIEVSDKEQNITNIQPPFIAQFGADFVAVEKVDAEQVSFFWKGVHQVLPKDKFTREWSGIVLLAEATEKSGEPDFKIHRQAEILALTKQVAFISASILTDFTI